MKYTKEQLVSAMQKYNQEYLDSVNFDSPLDINGFAEIDDSIESAEKQVNHLLSLVE